MLVGLGPSSLKFTDSFLGNNEVFAAGNLSVETVGAFDEGVLDLLVDGDGLVNKGIEMHFLT
jgi:hypothetical protein